MDNFPPVTRESLGVAIELGRSYYLNHIKEDGSFVYQLDLSNGEELQKNNEVRQAGALWGLSSLCRDRYTDQTDKAVRKGIDFFAKRVKNLPDGHRCLVFDPKDTIATGTVALYCLSLIEYLRVQGKFLERDELLKLRGLLDMHLAHLQFMELSNGSWGAHYDPENGIKGNRCSPYYDGESLLAYIKAARYLERTDLLPRINAALPKLLTRYTVECWEPGGDEEVGKGFSQWGCMALAEYVEAGWAEHRQLALDGARAIAWWLIYGHRFFERQGNTGYALEGLIGAWRVITAMEPASPDADKIRGVVTSVMGRLMTWQCASPLATYNQTLSRLPKYPKGAEGGIISAANLPLVRIDTHQHQMHAMLMMLQYMFNH